MINMVLNQLSISKYTLGTAQLGLNYGIANTRGLLSDKEALDLLDFAWENNIRCFDTAPAYGESEKRLGLFFRSKNIINNSDTFCVVTKVASQTEGLEKFELFSSIKQSIERSRDLLGLNEIPICLLHKTKDMYNDHFIDSLEKIRDEMLIKSFGVSVYNPKEVEDFISIDRFEVIQIPINLFDQRLIHSGLLNKLKHKNKIIFARSVFLQGLFFLDPNNLPSYLSSAKPYLQKLGEIATEYQMSINELAIRFLSSLNQISSIILGMENRTQIQENKAIFDKSSLPATLMEQLMNEFKEVQEEIINPTLWKKS